MKLEWKYNQLTKQTRYKLNFFVVGLHNERNNTSEKKKASLSSAVLHAIFHVGMGLGGDTEASALWQDDLLVSISFNGPLLQAVV